MNLQEWFVTNNSHQSNDLMKLVQHIPRQQHRCVDTLRLFLSGYETGFRLTTKTGRPTASLRLLVEMMSFVVFGWQEKQEYPCALSRGKDLPELYHENFPIDPRRWYITGLSERIWYREQRMMFYENVHQWMGPMLPGHMSKVVSYKEAGRRRQSTHHIAECLNDWRITHVTYEGLYHYGFSHKEPPCDGYAVLQKLMAKPNSNLGGTPDSPVEEVPAAQASGL